MQSEVKYFFSAKKCFNIIHIIFIITFYVTLSTLYSSDVYLFVVAVDAEARLKKMKMKKVFNTALRKAAEAILRAQDGHAPEGAAQEAAEAAAQGVSEEEEEMN